jgi:hypothetical protein
MHRNQISIMKHDFKDVYLKEKGEGAGKIWKKETLFEKSKNLIPYEVSVNNFSELNEIVWFGGPNNVKPSTINIAIHAKRIMLADLKYPIIISAEGRVMDGMHRLCKAWIEKKEKILAVKFDITPEPDFKIDIDEADFLDT